MVSEIHRFFEPPENCFPSLSWTLLFFQDFSKLHAFQTNFRFPWRFKKSGFLCTLISLTVVFVISCKRNKQFGDRTAKVFTTGGTERWRTTHRHISHVTGRNIFFKPPVVEGCLFIPHTQQRRVFDSYVSCHYTDLLSLGILSQYFYSGRDWLRRSSCLSDLSEPLEGCRWN